MTPIVNRRERERSRTAHSRARRPRLEGLEDRLLLYATSGDAWTYGSRITYSFVPDGTSIGGTPSSLFSTLNADYPTATWELAFQKAAAVWEAVAGINLAQVSDDGEAIGASGDQQDDPNVGDIRIGMMPEAAGELAFTFMPPPANGGTDAGDIFFNSTLNWGAGGFDLETVALHEIGHALGMAHSAVTTAVMYANYNGIKQSLTADDISGIDSIYGAVPANTSTNDTSATATDVTSQINGSDQVVLGGLSLVTQTEVSWFKVTVPANTNGTLTVTMQAANISSLSPKITVYYDNYGLLQGLAAASDPNSYGGTATVEITGVAPGEVFYFKLNAASGGTTAIGAYGLGINLSGNTEVVVPPPNTLVLSQPDQGGGSSQETAPPDSNQAHSHSHVSATDPPQTIQVGSLSGTGDYLTYNPHDWRGSPRRRPREPRR